MSNLELKIKTIPKHREKNTDKLIHIYFYICDCYDRELCLHFQRQSNNCEPRLTDSEVMTIYLYSISVEKRRDKKEIYEFADNYLRGWFPDLCDSYEGFLLRLNQLKDCFMTLNYMILEDKLRKCSWEEFVLLRGLMVSLVDSMPIIVAKGNRSFTAKVARDICDKGFCASKKLHYYGLKLHIIGYKRFRALPVAEFIGTTPASHNDLTTIKPILDQLQNRVIVGDKIYGKKDLSDWLAEHNNVVVLTPVKKKKGQKRLEAADQLFSTMVSQLRQPIEGLFGWLIEKTGIQNASKVRSTNGLLTQVYGKLAAAWMMLTLDCFAI